MIGIMQGRLVPRYKNLYQAFPVNYWKAEFPIAANLGLNHIEFIFDYDQYQGNPLYSAEGLKEIQKISSDWNVQVNSICADYFMARPFHHEGNFDQGLKTLRTLILHASQIGIKDIVIPCVDQSSLKNDEDKEILARALNQVLPIAGDHQVFLNLEADLAPRPFRDFLDEVNSPYLKVNYDIGNSSSLGHNPVEEFQAYGHLISDLHIKDRPKGEGSVKLGTGDADFETIFSLLKEYKFKGNIVLQASRSDHYLDEIKHVFEQLEFTQKFVHNYLTQDNQ